jgi:transcriptional regulator with XRE-family HTH domain
MIMQSDKLSEIVGKNIRRRRSELGMTQKELAERLDITQGALSDIENGKRSPGIKSIADFSEILNIPPSHLLSAETLASA